MLTHFKNNLDNMLDFLLFPLINLHAAELKKPLADRKYPIRPVMRKAGEKCNARVLGSAYARCRVSGQDHLDRSHRFKLAFKDCFTV